MSHGFTVLELIIVTVIVGVLAALAVPQYQSMVERARATEAVSAMNTLRQQVYACALEQDDVSAIPTACDMTMPMSSAEHFSVRVGAMIGTLDDPTREILLRARRNSYELSVSDPGGSWTCGASNSTETFSEVVMCATPTGTHIVGSGIYKDVKF